MPNFNEMKRFIKASFVVNSRLYQVAKCQSLFYGSFLGKKFFVFKAKYLLLFFIRMTKLIKVVSKRLNLYLFGYLL